MLDVPGGERILPWSELIAEVRHYRLRRSLTSLPPLALPVGAVRLARDLFDQPFAATDTPATLVSDLRLEDGGGLLRRIGAEAVAAKLVRLTGRTLAHRIIDWGLTSRKDQAPERR